MAVIGKGISVPSGLNFDFSLTVGSDVYTFNKNTPAYSNVGGVYYYRKDDIGWYLIVTYVGTATLKFNKISHLVDYCLCGGGGGGGGASQYYGSAGGWGGGADVTNVYNVQLTKLIDYPIIIGAGGTGGARSSSGWGGYGTAGEDSTFNGSTAAGGPRGLGASESSRSPANTKDQEFAFNDFSRIAQTLTGYNSDNPGSGGHAGYNIAGTKGYDGVFIIRSTPKK